MILTDQHRRPPRLINTGTGTIASAAFIKQGDVQRMASLGLYRHESIGPSPYGEWTLTSDAEGPLYRRTTVQAEYLRERWAKQARQTRLSKAQALLAQPIPGNPTPDDIERRIQALRTLQEQQ